MISTSPMDLGDEMLVLDYFENNVNPDMPKIIRQVKRSLFGKVFLVKGSFNMFQ